MKRIKVFSGTCRHPELVPVTHVAHIDAGGDVSLEFVWLRMKGRHPIYDGLGDRQWHSGVVADRADVAALLFPCRATVGR